MKRILLLNDPRAILEVAFNKWAKKKGCDQSSPFNVVMYLMRLNLLDEEKVNDFCSKWWEEHKSEYEYDDGR
jgi:hypothetical protein